MNQQWTVEFLLNIDGFINNDTLIVGNESVAIPMTCESRADWETVEFFRKCM